MYLGIQRERERDKSKSFRVFPSSIAHKMQIDCNRKQHIHILQPASPLSWKKEPRNAFTRSPAAH